MTSMWLALKGHTVRDELLFNSTRRKLTMKSFSPLLALTVVALAVAPGARAQTGSADAEGVKTKLKQMEDSWGKAFTDKDHGAAAVEPMLAADFAGFNSKGQKRDKSQLLDEMKKETDVVTVSTNDSMDVHVYGPSLATVVGTSTEKGKDKDGKAFNRSFCWVDTWMERNGKWECIAEAVTLLREKK